MRTAQTISRDRRKQYRISYEFQQHKAQKAPSPLFTAPAGLVTGVDTAPAPWPGGVSKLDFIRVGDVVVLRNDNDGEFRFPA